SLLLASIISAARTALMSRCASARPSLNFTSSARSALACSSSNSSVRVASVIWSSSGPPTSTTPRELSVIVGTVGWTARRMAARRSAAQQTFVIGEQLADMDPVVVDGEQPQLVGVRASANLDHRHYALQPAVDLDVTLHDDGVGE